MAQHFLRASDVARLWSEERARATAQKLELDEDTVIRLSTQGEHAVRAFAARLSLPQPERILFTKRLVNGTRPITLRTVYRYLQQGKSGYYQDNPPPMPVYPSDEPLPGQIPLWVPDDGETLADLERRVRGWWHSRKGAGVGGGRKKHAKPTARLRAHGEYPS